MAIRAWRAGARSDLTRRRHALSGVYGDKLVDKGRDGYLMQIGEVEAYGTPAVISDAATQHSRRWKRRAQRSPARIPPRLDAAIKALKDAIADENSTQSEINALIKAADAELAKFTVSTAEAAAALAEAKNAVSDGSGCVWFRKRP